MYIIYCINVSAITFYLCHFIIDIYQEVGGLRKQFVFNSIRLRALKHSLISAIPAPLRVVGSTNPSIVRPASEIIVTCQNISRFVHYRSLSKTGEWVSRDRVTQRICGRARLGSHCSVA